MSGRPSAPPAVRWITRTLEEAGHDTWAVGGAVRDALLGRPSGDWDLATHATPKQVRRIFRRTVPLGIEHGTVGVLSKEGVLYEVTTFRRDVETDGRHAVVEFADTIEEDLARRDFTINAIAWHALREELCDPFHGAEDLERSVLRTVGTAEERFKEDYLRILRALRFAGRFELRIEEATWEAACALVDRLPKLSPERVREELLKILESDPAPRKALELYEDSGVLGVLYPELSGSSERTSWRSRISAVEQLPVGRPHLRLAALLRGFAPDAVASVLLRLRLSNAQTDEIAHLAAAKGMPDESATDSAVRSWLSGVGAERLNPITRIELADARSGEAAAVDRCAAIVAVWRRARGMVRAGDPLTVGDLELDGRGLIQLGYKPGPHFGEALEQLLDWVLEDPARNVRDALEERAEVLMSGLSTEDGTSSAPVRGEEGESGGARG